MIIIFTLIGPGHRTGVQMTNCVMLCFTFPCFVCTPFSLQFSNVKKISLQFLYAYLHYIHMYSSKFIFNSSFQSCKSTRCNSHRIARAPFFEFDWLDFFTLMSKRLIVWNIDMLVLFSLTF